MNDKSMEVEEEKKETKPSKKRKIVSPSHTPTRMTLRSKYKKRRLNTDVSNN